MLDGKVWGSRKASSIPAGPVSTTPTPSTGMTGMLSRKALNIGCGFAAISGSIPANGLASSGGVVSMRYGPHEFLDGPEHVTDSLLAVTFVRETGPARFPAPTVRCRRGDAATPPDAAGRAPSRL